MTGVQTCALPIFEPIDVPLGTTYEQLLEMIYSVTDINKEHFRLIFSCKHPMKESYERFYLDSSCRWRVTVYRDGDFSDSTDGYNKYGHLP